METQKIRDIIQDIRSTEMELQEIRRVAETQGEICGFPSKSLVHFAEINLEQMKKNAEEIFTAEMEFAQ